MKTITTIAIAIITSVCSAEVWKELDLDKLADAIAQVESNNDNNKIGDNGKAVGAFQIWQVTVDDVNRIAGTQYKYHERTDPKKSREMFKIYIKHYLELRSKRNNLPITYETAARIWNGGPSGNRKPITKKYAEKVLKELNNDNN